MLGTLQGILEQLRNRLRFIRLYVDQNGVV